MTFGFDLVCASHDDAILTANLAASPIIGDGVRLHVERNAPAASIAYNRGLDATTADIVVFAHHDVFLPKGWDLVLAQRLADLDKRHPDWAVAGAYGVAMDKRHYGPVWTSSLGQVVGRVPMEPELVQSFDELLIVLKRSSGVRFDDGLPGWHLYGTDIVCAARAAGRSAYAVGLPCIHNDRFHEYLGSDFDECYRWMMRKWQRFLPVATPVTKLASSPVYRMRQRWLMRSSTGTRMKEAVDTRRSPAELAALCGWSDLAPTVRAS